MDCGMVREVDWMMKGLKKKRYDEEKVVEGEEEEGGEKWKGLECVYEVDEDRKGFDLRI